MLESFIGSFVICQLLCKLLLQDNAFLNVLSAVSYPAFYLRSSVFLSMFIASSHFLF